MPDIPRAIKTILGYIINWLWKTLSYIAFSFYYIIKTQINPKLIQTKQYRHLVLPTLSIIIAFLALSETVFAFQGESLRGPILLSRLNQPQEKLTSEEKITSSTPRVNQFTIATTDNIDTNLTDPATALGGAALVTPNDLLNDTPIMRTDIETYTVQAGDTIASIAKKFALNTKSILWENKLSATSVLRAGQELKILPIDGVTHTVKRGETLQQIANYYKASVEDVLDFNDLASSGDIYPGDFLIIPEGKIPPPPAPRRTTPPASNDKTLLAQKQTQLPAPEGNNCHLFVPGQCTWYVAKLRCVPWTGHAKSWISNARRMGYEIGKTPAVGAIMALNESWYGHVVYVTSFDDTTVTFTEMNHLGPYITDERTLKLNDRRIVGYIY